MECVCLQCACVKACKGLQDVCSLCWPIRCAALRNHVHVHGKGCLVCADTAMNTQTGSARCSSLKAGCRSKGA